MEFVLQPFTQAPQKINFQSVLRNSGGEIVSNKAVSLRISILSGSLTGTLVYSEIHAKTTDASGLISLHISNGRAGIFYHFMGKCGLFHQIRGRFQWWKQLCTARHTGINECCLCITFLRKLLINIFSMFNYYKAYC
jgi:hypothetical protein